MSELKKRIHDDTNGLDYILAGDYYIPDIQLDGVTKRYSLGKWGRMHRDWLRENNTLLLSELTLKGQLYNYLSDLNEQAQDRYERIVRQMMESESVTEDLKRRSQMDWVRAMNSIASRAEEIIRNELIYT